MYSNDDIGTDINWELNNNDIAVIQDENNIVASICRRINTNLDETFYDNYGCNLEQYLGWKKNNITLNFIRNTINEALTQEPRIKEFDTELSYVDDGIKIKINLTYSEDETLELSLVVDNKDLIYQDDRSE